MARPRFSLALILLSSIVLLGPSFAAAQTSCPTEPGLARAACFCKTVTEYKYYADTANGCSGAMWCYGPGQSTYTTCAPGTLFSQAAQVCDWAANVKCDSTSPSPPPASPATPSPSPATPSPSPAAPPATVSSPSPAPTTSSPTPGASCSAGYTQGGGACGPANGGLCCPNGQCCSKHGYCGISDAHCAAASGCQALYGSCSGSQPPAAPSPSPAVPSPATPSPSPSPAVTPTASPSPAVASSPAPPASPPAPGSKTLPSGPLMVAYYQTWSAPWASTGANMDLAKIPSYVNVIMVSFAKPDCTYAKGSLALSGTGLDFSSDGKVVKDAIATLKAANPNTRVMLAVGGATYYNFAGLNTKCIKDIVDDFGFDGVDLDYEPQANCVIGSSGVTCPTDAESVTVTAALRAALPAGQYLLSTASWHVGMFGEGAFANAQPRSAYTGVNLAMAKSAAGQALDLISIMTYDAGNKASTGFDWAESYRAHRVHWKTQAVAIGVEIPPEAWGGNVIALPEVTERAKYARDYSGGAQYGMMLWSIHKQGCPNAQQITSAVCSAYSLAADCSKALPMSQSSCTTGRKLRL